MTMKRFQATVLKLANQMMVRTYLALNYPQEPQWMAFETDPVISPHNPDHERLCGELYDTGFRQQFYAMRDVWIVDRTPE